MFKYFWTFETDLPPGSGVETFGPVHLAWASIGLILVFAVLAVYKRQSVQNRRKIQIVLSYLLAAGYVIRWIWAALIGHYSIVNMLPLHLCYVSVFVVFAAVHTGRTTLKEFAYCCSLPAAIASVTTPDMGTYPLIHYYYLQYAMAHLTLVLFPLLWIAVDGYRPDVRRLPRCFALLMIIAGTAFTVNQLIGSNYMFLSYAPKDTPLEIFETWFGNPGYLVPTFLLILAIWIVLYLPWVIRDWKKRSRRT